MLRSIQVCLLPSTYIMKIYFIAPPTLKTVEIMSAIKQVVRLRNETDLLTTFDEVDNLQIRLDSNFPYETEISSCDLVIADISEENSFVLYEIGFARAKAKQIILIAEKNSFLPLFIVTSYNIHYYDRNRLVETLIEPLRHQLSEVTTDNAQQNIELIEKEVKTVFISYSRRDKQYLERLRIHISPLQKYGNFAYWADDKIKPGENWKEEIEKALDKAAIAILLISADFLASEYVINNELPVLLQSAEKKSTVILPIIVKPCLFKAHEALYAFQALNDPDNPLSKLNENDSEEYLVKAAEYILSVAKNK